MRRIAQFPSWLPLENSARGCRFGFISTQLWKVRRERWVLYQFIIACVFFWLTKSLLSVRPRNIKTYSLVYRRLLALFLQAGSEHSSCTGGIVEVINFEFFILTINFLRNQRLWYDKYFFCNCLMPYDSLTFRKRAWNGLVNPACQLSTVQRPCVYTVYIHVHSYAVFCTCLVMLHSYFSISIDLEFSDQYVVNWSEKHG